MTDSQTVRRIPEPPRRGAVFANGGPFGDALMEFIRAMPMCVRMYVSYDDHVIVISDRLDWPHKGWHRGDRAAADALAALAFNVPVCLHEIHEQLDAAERKAFAKAVAILLTGEEA
jgi:hypothetical protein